MKVLGIIDATPGWPQFGTRSRPALWAALGVLALGPGTACGSQSAQCVIIPNGSGSSVVVEESKASGSSALLSPRFRIEDGDGNQEFGFFTAPMPEYGIAIVVDDSTLHVVTNPTDPPPNSVEVCRLNSKQAVFGIEVDTSPGAVVVIDNRADTLIGISVPDDRQMPLIVPVSTIL